MITKLSSEVTRCAQLSVFEKGVEQKQNGHGLSDDRSHSSDDPPGPGWGGIVEEHCHDGGDARSKAEKMQKGLESSPKRTRQSLTGDTRLKSLSGEQLKCVR